MQPRLRLYHMCIVIDIMCSSLCFAALNVEFNTTRSMYTVGDNVTLTCYVKTDWLYVTIYRNNTDIYDCYSTLGGCITPDNSPEPYIAKIINSNPTVFINNVTFEDSEVNFTCQWTSLYAAVSFNVQDRKLLNRQDEINTEDIYMVAGWLILGVLIVPVAVAMLVYVKIRGCANKNKRGHVRYAKKQQEACCKIPPQEEQQTTKSVDTSLIADSGISEGQPSEHSVESHKGFRLNF